MKRTIGISGAAAAMLGLLSATALADNSSDTSSATSSRRESSVDTRTGTHISGDDGAGLQKSPFEDSSPQGQSAQRQKDIDEPRGRYSADTSDIGDADGSPEADLENSDEDSNEEAD